MIAPAAVILWLATMLPTGALDHAESFTMKPSGKLTAMAVCEKAKKDWLREGEALRSTSDSELRVRNPRFALCITLTPSGTDT
jgi:hypothetical protein